MKFNHLALPLLTVLLLSPLARATDLKAIGQQLMNKGVESAVSGAVSGTGGKQIAKDTQQAVQDQAKQEAATASAEFGKNAPAAETNPLGSMATGMAAQAASAKAGQLVKGSNSALAGQVAGDAVKGAAGMIDQKLKGTPEPAPAAAPVSAPVKEAAPAAKKTTKVNKAKTKKKKH